MEEQLKVALIQCPLHWEDPKANRAYFSEKMTAMDESVDLVVLPEMFTTGFTMYPEDIVLEEGEKTLQWLQETAQQQNIAITGSVVFHENQKFYNRLFFVHPDGHYDTYDKKHTFTLAGEHKVYAAGIEKIVVDYKGFRICPLICYDLRFPVWARNVEDYDVLLYVANWPKPRVNAWDTLLKARAIENMAYVIGVNRIGQDASGHKYVGHSAVYDVLGEQLAFSNKEAVLYATLSKAHITYVRDKLKFLDDRDDFTLQ